MKKRKLIGVITTDPENIYQTTVMKGIFAKADELDYDIVVFTTFVKASHPDKEYLLGETNIFNVINFDLLDGLIVLTIGFKYTYDNMLYDRLLNMVDEKCKCPVVSIDESFGNYEMVSTNDEKEFEKITDHVIEVHNCKNIYLLAGAEGTYTSQVRERGFRNSMAAHGLEVPDKNIIYGEFWYTFGERVARQLADGELEKPDAFIAASDYIALGLVNDAIRYGMKIPEDFIVTGYDCVLEAKANIPSLTSYVPPIFEAGEKAVINLAKRIENRPINSKVSSTGCLKCGMTCGCSSNNIALREREDYGYILPYNQPGTDMYRFTNGYMAEFLTASKTMDDCMYNIMANVYLIDDCYEYFLCMCPGWEEFDADSESENMGEIGYPEQMKVCVYRCTEEIIHEGPSAYNAYTNSYFDTSVMHPRLFEGEREKPAVFHFVPVHFNGRRMGYAVTRFPMKNATIGSVYRNWSRYVNNALEMIRVRNQLFLKSIRDPMTGLFNCAGMKANFREVLRKSKKKESDVFVVAIDMNNLKYINDTFGHNEGDKAIKALAICVYSVCGNDDICVRTGGDEFLIIGECSYGEDYVKKRVEKIVQKLNSYNEKSKSPYDVTASYGICCSDAEDEDDIEQMIEVADERMYADKAVYKSTMSGKIPIRDIYGT